MPTEFSLGTDGLCFEDSRHFVGENSGRSSLNGLDRDFLMLEGVFTIDQIESWRNHSKHQHLFG